MLQSPVQLGRILLWTQRPDHGLLCHHQQANGAGSWAEKRHYFASKAAWCDTLYKQQAMVKIDR
jgi:hypothetical protein